MRICFVVAAWLLAPLVGAAPVSVDGSLFEIGTLDNGELAYMNRTYTWQGVPEPLRGWQFTRMNGGVRGELSITPATDGVLHLAGIPSGVDLVGWRLIREWSFHYTDQNRTKVRVFSRTCRAGERLDIPQGGWTGIMLVAPEIVGGATEPTADHSEVPGVVIDHSPKCTQSYVGCPSIAVLPDGRYVASHSFFGQGIHRGSSRAFRSEDKGRTWRRLPDIKHQSFSCLFVHRGALYIMGGGYQGKTVIRRSDDAGETWTDPKDEKTGILLPETRYHSAPVPVLVHSGRIWRAMEDRKAGRGWPREFRAFMMSAAEDADLLQAESWTSTNRLASKDTWLDDEFEGWLEGNAVATPDGAVVNVLRAHTWIGGIAAIVRVSADGKTSTFDPDTDFVDFPGGATKFTIRHDPVSKLYWSLANAVDEDTRNGRSASMVRNTLVLTSSPDLRTWTVRRRVLHHPDPAFHAFQYVDWQFDGDDMVAVSRTAYDDGIGGPHNYHNANYFTFHRVAAFRAGSGN